MQHETEHRAGARAPVILLAAGEPSGDLHGAAVARELKRRWPDAQLFGLGGPRMAAEGVELIAGLDRLAVMGFVEVLAELPYFVRLLRRLEREIATRRVDLVVPIDYPGLNLRLARAARRAGVPVLYYIAPQVWAWHASRTRRLAELADRLAVVLPFETPIFAAAGAHVEFVGHPLLDAGTPAPAREEFCAAHGLDPSRPLLALFPGSRAQELDQHLELFASVGRALASKLRVQPLIAATANLSDRASAAGLPVTTDAHAALAHVRAALVKSGTTTLQAALARVPMVIAYRTHPLTYWLARRLVEVEHIGLVNLVAGERLVPELIQHEATPARLAAALEPLLLDTPERERVCSGLTRVRDALAGPRGAGGAAARVAELAAELLDER